MTDLHDSLCSLCSADLSRGTVIHQYGRIHKGQKLHTVWVQCADCETVNRVALEGEMPSKGVA